MTFNLLRNIRLVADLHRKNKKVLPHDCKRRTARGVSGGWGGVTLVLVPTGVPPPPERFRDQRLGYPHWHLWKQYLPVVLCPRAVKINFIWIFGKYWQNIGLMSPARGLTITLRRIQNSTLQVVLKILLPFTIKCRIGRRQFSSDEDI